MKKISIIFILAFIAFPGQKMAICQDLLYKKDSTVIRVKILEFNGRTITYQNPDDSLSRTFYLSKSVLDSIKYQNGRTLTFKYLSNTKEVPKEVLNRNYIGTDLVNVLSGLINLEYERLSKTGNAAFVTAIFINASTNKERYWEIDHNPLEYTNFRPFYFLIKTGIDYYPFNFSRDRISLMRTSTGLYLLAGSVKKIDLYSYYDMGYKTIPKFALIPMWAVRERFYLGKNVEFTAGMEISLVPFFTFFNPELTFSLSF